MISNPFPLPSTSAVAWANGFFNGFSGPNRSIEPPPDIAESDDAGAFSSGALAGQQSAIEGLAIYEECVSAAEDASEAVHIVTGGEVLHGLFEIYRSKVAAGLAGIAVAVIEFAVTLPKRTRPPEEVLQNDGQQLVDSLSAFGVGSLELFCGVGVDDAANDCEIRLTPFFRSFQQAKNAAVAMNRPQWLVVSWRTDACNAFRVMEAS